MALEFNNLTDDRFWDVKKKQISWPLFSYSTFPRRDLEKLKFELRKNDTDCSSGNVLVLRQSPITVVNQGALPMHPCITHE